MRITDVRTFLMNASPPGKTTWRHWLFVKVYTDEGLYGVGECWGWPRVVETAIHDLKPLVIGEDPCHIERLWQKMFAAVMGHGMTGVVGSGAMTGIEMALWDIKGKVLETPVWNLLGGKMRDRIRLYGHAFDMARAEKLIERGFTGLKLFGWKDCVSRVETLRDAFRSGHRPDGGRRAADPGRRRATPSRSGNALSPFPCCSTKTRFRPWTSRPWRGFPARLTYRSPSAKAIPASTPWRP